PKTPPGTYRRSREPPERRGGGGPRPGRPRNRAPGARPAPPPRARGPRPRGGGRRGRGAGGGARRGEAAEPAARARRGGGRGGGGAAEGGGGGGGRPRALVTVELVQAAGQRAREDEPPDRVARERGARFRREAAARERDAGGLRAAQRPVVGRAEAELVALAG